MKYKTKINQNNPNVTVVFTTWRQCTWNNEFKKNWQTCFTNSFQLPNYEIDTYLKRVSFPFDYHFFAEAHKLVMIYHRKLAITKAVKQLLYKILIQLCTVCYFSSDFRCRLATQFYRYVYVFFFRWLLLPLKFFYSIDIEFFKQQYIDRTNDSYRLPSKSMVFAATFPLP